MLFVSITVNKIVFANVLRRLVCVVQRFVDISTVEYIFHDRQKDEQ